MTDTIYRAKGFEKNTWYNDDVYSVGKNVIPLTDGQKRFKTISWYKDNNLPIPKTLFYVDFKLNNNVIENIKKYTNYFLDYSNDYFTSNSTQIQFNNEDIKFLSSMVKNINKPEISFETEEFNCYNNRDIIYKKTSFSDLTITFFNTREMIIQKVFIDYLKHIDKRFTMSNHLDGNKEKLLTKPFEYNYNLNYPNGFDMASNTNIFEYISVIEYMNNKYIEYKYFSPKLTKIKFGDSELGSYESSDITVSFKPYNISIKQVDNIDIDIGTKIQTLYKQ